MPVVRGIRVLNAISTGNTTPACLDTLLSDAGRLADVTQVLSSPSYSCMLGQSNTASHTAFRSNNAMNAIFANPVAGCVLYQTSTSRNNMLGSSCYYNHMMSFSTPEATNSFTHFGNTPCMLNCAFASCTAFLNTAVQSNTEIAKLLTCNSCVSACFRGSACAIQQAVGTPGRPAYWLGDATAFSCLVASGLPTAFGNTVFLETLNRDIACVMCTPTLNCCAWNLAAPASTYTESVCAINEVVNKGACGLGLTSCNFVCWYGSTYGVPCMITRLASGNTYFMDQVNALNSFRQRSCLYYLCDCSNTYQSCIPGNQGATNACRAVQLIKTEIIAGGGTSYYGNYANNSNLPLTYFHSCFGQRICPFTIANGSQLSNTEVEYLGRWSKCNYNVITHADCRLTLISPGFWNQSSGIACFKNCYCCSIDRTTANTSGLTLNCSLYYTADNGASFNRLCVPLPACIFQQLCGNCCCQFTVRYGLSSFACCNYIYTGWIISDCGTSFGACCNPAYFKTGHSRVCIHSANSQPNYDTWTHYPDVPLPLYTIAFCDEYFAGVSPMRTDGYQTTLGLCNQTCCQTPGQYAMMFSFGKVGDCVRISCDNFINCQPSNVTCFTPASNLDACCSLPARTHNNWGTCYLDYFQGHGSGSGLYCQYSPYLSVGEVHGGVCLRMGVNSAATSHTLIYKNSGCTADSKAFLVGWRSFAMMYGGTASAAYTTCAVVRPARCGQFYYNCNNCRGSTEALPYGCGYFSSSAGVNVWCYGSQANNTMQGSEIDNSVLGGSSSSWTNFTFSNAKIIGNKLALHGSIPPRIFLCACFAAPNGCDGGTCAGVSMFSFCTSTYGCQNAFGQSGHVTLLNTDGVVGSLVCCLDSMHHSTPFYAVNDSAFCASTLWCSFCSGRCCCCVDNMCSGISQPGGYYGSAQAYTADYAGLKTINLYGSSNSILSFAAYPNMTAQTACVKGGGYCCNTTACLTCYTSFAPTGQCPFRSDQSQFCVKDLGDFCVYQFSDAQQYFGRFGTCVDGYFHNCNPGFANTVGVTTQFHVYASGFQPCQHCSIYVPPTANQDTTLYNFCYILTPHHDICLDGPFCWNQTCECFPPGSTVPCSPCCPCCNVRHCCVCGYDGRYATSCLFCLCQLTREEGFVRQHVRYHDAGGHFPCCQTPSRYCCPVCCGCPGWGNHHRTTAEANNTYQCAMAISFPYICGANCQGYSCDGFCGGCSCFTYCTISPYSNLIRTCNQSGPNCMWYDYMESVSGEHSLNSYPQMVGCKSFWNARYIMDIALGSSCDTRANQGIGYMNTNDTKKAGFRLISTGSQTCQFVADGVCYPIRYTRLTRGSGGALNTQNSIHVAYFDLVPFRCTVSGGGGFYANGNACPSASGLCCCLMYVKQDIFHNI